MSPPHTQLLCRRSDGGEAAAHESRRVTSAKIQHFPAFCMDETDTRVEFSILLWKIGALGRSEDQPARRQGSRVPSGRTSSGSELHSQK